MSIRESPNALPPLVVEAVRGACVETRHLVSAAVVGSDGDVVSSHGDIDWAVPARSTVKLFQALPLITSGAADALGLTDQQLALACGSHSGEAFHCDAVRHWLAQLDLDEGSLGCAPSLPMLPGPQEAYLRAGGVPTRAHHNCSGKHVGFLALARHLGADLDGYLDPGHPVQRAVLESLGAALHTPVAEIHLERDGCGAPVVCTSLRRLGTATAIIAVAPPGAPEHRLHEAMAAHPELVSGPGRFDARVHEATDGRVVAKVGAEGIHVAVVRELGLGVAVKVHSGERRAVELALHHLLVGLEVLDAEGFADVVRPLVVDDADEPVGALRLARRRP